MTTEELLKRIVVAYDYHQMKILADLMTQAREQLGLTLPARKE